MSIVGPILVGVLFILVMAAFPDGARQRVNALLIAGAGAVYWSGGLGVWEFPFGLVMIYVAYRGLDSWRWIGVGWLLHTCWDVVHHLKGNPIIPFVHDSSFGCAICDPVIALWCFAGGRPVIARRAHGSLRGS
ncbi:hypothetical protein SAMN05421541_1401 [Actinoplanes philippinensis]|uniref:Uncharacterized protein n=2 Tax=Actinoplanes philippinensis TaxID=35752 RepID=A0A1I2N9K2_9ACTN|nr:DUF6010 family protein [Actinoplanes philippinensis]SFF99559.1 hypothetical protein SAMN05421541_1401 [Actinoplanes philippinensis]